MNDRSIGEMRLARVLNLIDRLQNEIRACSRLSDATLGTAVVPEYVADVKETLQGLAWAASMARASIASLTTVEVDALAE